MKKSKRILPIFLKICLLLVSFSLLFYNCDNDLDAEQEVVDQKESLNFSLEENINVSAQNLLVELNIPKHKTSLRHKSSSSKSDISGLEVLTASVSKVTTKDYTVYTFPVNNHCDTSYDLQNLVVVKQKTGSITYTLANYTKEEGLNPNFPYQVNLEKLDSSLNLIDNSTLSRETEEAPGDKEGDTSFNSTRDDENRCFNLVYLHCGCQGGTNDPTHTSDKCKCGVGSKPFLRETICGYGSGETVNIKADPCYECAIDPDGNKPNSFSTGLTQGSSGSSTPPKHYTYNGQQICDSSGACSAPLFIPLISTQTFEQVLGLNTEEINYLNQLENLEVKNELEVYLIRNDYSEAAKQQVKKALKIAPHLDFLRKYWPQTAEEWAVIGEIFKSIAGDVVLGMVPGYDFVESIQHIVDGNIGQAALAFGLGVVSFSPLIAAKIYAKIVKAAVKLSKICKKISTYLKPLGSVLKKGFKPKYVDDVLELVDDSGHVIANGADEVEIVVRKISKPGRKFWTSETTFRSVKVYKRNDIIDGSLIDNIGRTNKQRMQSGIAPIGPDGKSVNLHHMLQSDAAGIAEMTQTFHKTNHATIHINPNTIPSGINRSAFATWKRNYWKHRANDF